MLEPYLHEAVPQERPRAWAFGRPSPRAFSRLCLAISDQLRIEFLYSSMGNPQPHLRTVEPHSIVQTARRWHVRGFCVEKGDFRDFVLGRMSQIRLLAEGQQMDSREDVAWKTEVEIHIVAHPLLSLEQQGVVRQEYFRGTSARIELCRAAVLPYFLDDIAAATDISTQKPPEFQLAVDNVEDCRPWLFPK
ncbi:helix-turn-helix transcriptional regulator [Achromobacter xylosoxidans]|nr:WYL domain-containing protein [Achromobacter xylosoxidans]